MKESEEGDNTMWPSGEPARMWPQLAMQALQQPHRRALARLAPPSPSRHVWPHTTMHGLVVSSIIINRGVFILIWYAISHTHISFLYSITLYLRKTYLSIRGSVQESSHASLTNLFFRQVIHRSQSTYEIHPLLSLLSRESSIVVAPPWESHHDSW